MFKPARFFFSRTSILWDNSWIPMYLWIYWQQTVHKSCLQAGKTLDVQPMLMLIKQLLFVVSCFLVHCYNPSSVGTDFTRQNLGGGPRVVVSTAAFHARGRGSVPVWKKQKMFLPHPRVKVSIVGSLRDRGVACSASDRQGSNFESCVWRTVSS